MDIFTRMVAEKFCEAEKFIAEQQPPIIIIDNFQHFHSASELIIDELALSRTDKCFHQFKYKHTEMLLQLYHKLMEEQKSIPVIYNRILAELREEVNKDLKKMYEVETSLLEKHKEMYIQATYSVEVERGMCEAARSYLEVQKNKHQEAISRLNEESQKLEQETKKCKEATEHHYDAKMKLEQKLVETADGHSNAMKELKDCLICRANPRSILFDPCGHYHYCSACVESTHVCFTCRGNIVKKIRVYE